MDGRPFIDPAAYPASDNKGPALLGSVWTLNTLAMIVYVIRLWSRLSPKFALTAADYTITISLAAHCVSISLTTVAVVHGFGRHSIYISRDEQRIISQNTFFSFIFSNIASAFARISIACLLLQVTSRRWWRAAIWATIVLQALNMILYIVVQLVQCQSVLSKKLDIKQSQCLKPQTVWSFTYAQISISMFSDLVCAVIPIFLIKSLTRSLVEKVLTSVLLASCIFASLLGIVKIYYMVTFDFTSPDGYYLMVDEFLWCRIEAAVIVIAACAPLLKCPIERLLSRYGLGRHFEIPRRSLNEISLNDMAGSVKDTDWGN